MLKYNILNKAGQIKTHSLDRPNETVAIVIPAEPNVSCELHLTGLSHGCLQSVLRAIQASAVGKGNPLVRLNSTIKLAIDELPNDNEAFQFACS